jgi:hypothetical protein
MFYNASSVFLECNAATRVLCGVEISILVKWGKVETMDPKGNRNVNYKIGIKRTKEFT